MIIITYNRHPKSSLSLLLWKYLMRSSIPDELIITDCTATDISFFCTAIRIHMLPFSGQCWWWWCIVCLCISLFVYFFLCFNSWPDVSLIENNNVCNKPVSWYAHVYHKTKALFNSSSDISSTIPCVKRRILLFQKRIFHILLM